MANLSKYPRASVSKVVRDVEVLTRKQLRAVRDFERKEQAYQKMRKLAKSVPKDKRELNVKLSRRALAQQNAFLTLRDDDTDTVFQSGLLMGAAVSGAALYTAKKVCGLSNTLAETVKATGESTEGVLESVKDALSQAGGLANLAGGTLNNANALTSKVMGVVDQISSAFSSFIDSLKKASPFLWAIPGCVFLYSILKTVGNNCLTCGIFGILGSLFFPDIWGRLSKWFKPDITAVSEAGIGLNLGFLSTLVCLVTVPKKDPAVMVGELMRRASMAERSTSGFQHIFDGCLKVVEKLINTLMKMLGKGEVQWSDQVDRMLRNWSSKVDDFEKLCTSGNPTIDQLKEASITQQEGLGLRQVVKTHHARLYLDKYLDRLEARLQPHRGALNNADAFRQMPVFTLLGGGSGVGKTSVLKALAAVSMLLAGEVKAVEAIQHMWQKGTTEYYNGYIQQKVLVLDDCFQLKTTASCSDIEAMTVIRGVGNFAFPLNYADVESKGRFYFNSPLIIGTTNVANIHDQVTNIISCPKAVTRRIKYGGWIYVDPSFQNESGELDYKKVSAEHVRRLNALGEGCNVEDVARCIPWEAWKYVPHDFNGVEPTVDKGGEYGLYELVTDMAAELKSRKALHHQEVETYTEWLQKLESVLPQSGLTESFMEESSFVRSYALGPTGPVIDDTFYDQHEIQAEDADPTGSVDFSFDRASDFPNDPIGTRVRMRDIKVLDEFPGLKMDHEEFENTRKFRLSWVQDCLGWVRKMLSKIPEYFFTATGMASSYGVTPSADLACDVLSAFFVSAGVLAVVALSVSFLVKLACGISSAIWSVISGFFGKIAPESNIKSEPAKKKVTIDGIPRFAEQQLGNPPEDVMADKFYNNTFKLLVVHPDGPEHYGSVGQILFVDGDIAVMPDHFDHELAKALGDDEWGDDMILQSCLSDRFDVTIPIKSFLGFQRANIKGVDVCYVKFDWATLKTNASITHLFLNETQLSQAVRSRDIPVRLDIARYYYRKTGGAYGGGETRLVRTVMNCPTIEIANGVPITSADGSVLRFNSLLKYEAPTVAGDCGAPLTIAEPRFWGGKAILGIHVAGRAGSLARQGFATIITQENVIWARKLLNGYADKFSEDLASRSANMTFSQSGRDALQKAGLVGGSVEYLGTLPQAIHMSSKSKIKKSAFFGTYDDAVGICPQAPAVMSAINIDGKRVEPMGKAIEAYQSPLLYKPLDDIDAIVELATKPHWRATRNSCRDLLSFSEALCGREGLKLKPVARKTSPGYPYSLDGDLGKMGILGSGEEFDLTTEKCLKLRERVEYVVESAKQGVRLSHIYSDFLKDELRPLAKVSAAATRAISGAPLDYVVAVRMYFGTFLAAMFVHHTVSGMAPGINHYTEWHVLAESLSKFGGDRVFGGDFSRFDASEQPYIHMEILKYINRWYAFNNSSWCVLDDKVRSILWLDLIHSRHLTGFGGRLEHVVQWNKSLPSGHPLTTPVNSLYSLITLTACYVRSTVPRDYRDMWQKAYLCTFGDDNVVGVSEAVSEVFNQVTVAEKMNELFGLSYTSDKKGEALVAYESIEKVTFLKRTFVPECIGSSSWTAPLNRDSFLFVPYWYKNSRSEREDLRVNLENSLGEMCLHNVSVWDEFYPIIEAFCAYNGIDLPFLSREAARSWIASRTDIWY